MKNSMFKQEQATSSPAIKPVIDLQGFEISSKQRPVPALPSITEELLQNLQNHLGNKFVAEELINKLPKVDLHVHGEAGFITVKRAREIAARNGLQFREDLVHESGNLFKYRGVEDFQGFLDDFFEISDFIRTPQDIEDIAYDFYRYCYENNVIFALPGISWVQCKKYMSFTDFNQAYNRALVRGMQDFGEISVLRLRYYQERHHYPEPFNEIWKDLKDCPNGLITTIGLAGNEGPFPFELFKEFYKEGKELRLSAENPAWYFTAHMEKSSDAKIILESTELLDWVAHGQNSADEEEYLNIMKDKGVTLESCPISDITVYPNEIPGLDKHKQFIKFLEKQIISLNSDDPAFFGGVDRVYRQVFAAKLADLQQLLQCTVNGLLPAQHATQEELKQNQPVFYQDQQRIAMAGLLKVQFFQYYCMMLPALLNLSSESAKKLFAINLKTSEASLAELLSEFRPVADESISNALSGMLQCKCKIRSLSQAILQTTVDLHKIYIQKCENAETNQDDNEADDKNDFGHAVASSILCLNGMLS
ncbi:hypothetical protein B1207_08475 [Legionella quinlivanii]|uniref:Adenosine deaminase domain-containing protein n=1 Tax=Legionella quinlivanii TaxID=45073 RepID=A0A364LIG0_9GAMM|nr:hypothetical protein [Legionella quinlivanii]RAP36179.1 hypothetical protein B1207_08475 [Legionella quinlivanii]